MFSLRYVQFCAAVVFSAIVCVTACGAELPTVKDVLDAHAANVAKLTKLHLQMTQTHENTEADRQTQRTQAAGLEAIAKAMESSKNVPGLEKNALTPEFLHTLANSKQLSSENKQVDFKDELFLSGDDYQVRSMLRGHEKDDFPSAAVTPASLVHDYAFVRIYSRCNRQTPAARIWPGYTGARAKDYVMLTTKDVGETDAFWYPPFTSGMKPSQALRHPIDTFFSAKPDRYRVIDEETKNARKLTIVDVSIPTGEQETIIGKDGKAETQKQVLWYRGWLDLKRGAVPITLEFRYGVEGQQFERQPREEPAIATTAADIRRLSNGAYYPAITVSEWFGKDPATPYLTAAEYQEALAGKRPMPKSVVLVRHTWACTTVDDHVPGGEFFVLQFPQGQVFYDFDAKKVAGGLESKPPVNRGDAAR